MKVEREQFLGVGYHERSNDRKGYANGYKPKEVQTRMGALELAVPQVRGLGFYPQSMEPDFHQCKSWPLVSLFVKKSLIFA
jgi:putative transposase